MNSWRLGGSPALEGRAEVEEHGPPADYDHVRRLDVEVDEAALVDVRERRTHVDRHAQRVRDAEPPLAAGPDQPTQRGPVEVFHQQVRGPRLAEEPDDVRMIERAQHAGLATRPALGTDDLAGHGAPGVVVPHDEHGTATTPSDPTDDAQVTIRSPTTHPTPPCRAGRQTGRSTGCRVGAGTQVHRSR